MKALILLGVLFLIGCSSECGSPAPLPPPPAPTPVVIMPGPAPAKTFGVDRYGAPRARRFAAAPPTYEYRLVQVPVVPAAPAASPCAPAASPCQPCPDEGGVVPGPEPAPGPDPFGGSRLPPPPPPPPASRPQ